MKRRNRARSVASGQRRRRAASPRERAPSAWQLRLYIAGRTARAAAALENLQRICEEHLHGQYQLEVVDLLANRSWRAATRSWRFPRWCASFPRR